MSEQHNQLAGARPRDAGCLTTLPESLTQPHSAGEQSGLGEGMSTGLAIGFGAGRAFTKCGTTGWQGPARRVKT